MAPERSPWKDQQKETTHTHTIKKPQRNLRAPPWSVAKGHIFRARPSHPGPQGGDASPIGTYCWPVLRHEQDLSHHGTVHARKSVDWNSAESRYHRHDRFGCGMPRAPADEVHFRAHLSGGTPRCQHVMASRNSSSTDRQCSPDRAPWNSTASVPRSAAGMWCATQVL